MNTIDLLGVPFVAATPEAVARAILDEAVRAAGEEPARSVAPAPVHTLVVAAEDEEFREVLRRTWMVVPDGMPLVWLGRRLGAKDMHRIYGPDLVLNVCRFSAQLYPDIALTPTPGMHRRPVRHFFYGGAEGVADAMAEELTTRFPGLAVAGTFTPPYRPLTEADRDEHARLIREADADIVWVGLGSPKQERWMDVMAERLPGMVLLSVGAAFDFHTGRKKQAPRWMGRVGLEWLFRLATEPKRLGRRYLYSNPRFLALAVRQLVTGKVPGDEEEEEEVAAIESGAEAADDDAAAGDEVAGDHAADGDDVAVDHVADGGAMGDDATVDAAPGSGGAADEDVTDEHGIAGGHGAVGDDVAGPHVAGDDAPAEGPASGDALPPHKTNRPPHSED